MIASILALVDPGDEVVVFEPFYENYGPDAILAGATPRASCRCTPPDWSFDPDELRGRLRRRARAASSSTRRNNPTGKVFSRDELRVDRRALPASGTSCAFTDEIYEHILYDGATHVPIATLPGMGDRTVTINALSKTYSVTGWRVGWAIAAAGADRGDPQGARLPDRRRRRTAAGGRRRRRWRCRDATTRTLARELPRAPRPAAAGARAAPASPCRRPRGAYYILADITGARGAGRRRLRAPPGGRTAGVGAVPGIVVLLRRRRSGPRLIRFAFPKKRRCAKPSTPQRGLAH